jgi:hypothetical protein
LAVEAVAIVTACVRTLFFAATLVTLSGIVLWQATGGDYYTKYEVIEEVPRQIDPDDPFADAGFYDDAGTETVRRDEFRFGLLPTPQSIFDKHAISVLSFAGPSWFVAIGFAWWSRRKQKQAAKTLTSPINAH